jgi:hypothetical protein
MLCLLVPLVCDRVRFLSDSCQFRSLRGSTSNSALSNPPDRSSNDQRSNLLRTVKQQLWERSLHNHNYRNPHNRGRWLVVLVALMETRRFARRRQASIPSAAECGAALARSEAESIGLRPIFWSPQNARPLSSWQPYSLPNTTCAPSRALTFANICPHGLAGMQAANQAGGACFK